MQTPKSPLTGKPMRHVKEKRIWRYRGRDIEYTQRLWLCEDTGEKFTTDEDDTEALLFVQSEYRRLYGD